MSGVGIDKNTGGSGMGGGVGGRRDGGHKTGEEEDPGTMDDLTVRVDVGDGILAEAAEGAFIDLTSPKVVLVAQAAGGSQGVVGKSHVVDEKPPRRIRTLRKTEGNDTHGTGRGGWAGGWDRERNLLIFLPTCLMASSR